MGDSHTEKALKPTVFNSAVNISQQSEPYFVTYWKLKEISSNNNIDTLMLGFSYHNLSAFNEKKLIDPKWSDEMFRRIYPLVNFNDLNVVKFDYFSYLKALFNNMCLLPKIDHLNYIGSYSNSFKSNIQDFELVINRHFFYNNEPQIISLNEIKYLNKIVEFCKHKHIELVLVTTPLNQVYLKKIPLEYISKFEKLKVELKNKNIMVLDLSEDNFKDNEFFNADHLNERGALRFSKKVRNILDLKQLNK